MSEADVALDKQRERYWLRALTDVRVAEPSTPAEAEVRPVAPWATIAIPRALLDRALAASQGAELGLFVLLAAAAAGTLRRARVDDPVTLGTVAFDGVAPGPAGNPLLLHTRVGLATTFGALVQAMKAQVLAAIEHQSYAFTALLGRLRDRGESLAPECFELALASRALHGDTESLGRFGLVMTLVREGDAAWLELGGGASGGRERAEQFARSALTLLADGLQRPQRPLAALRLLDADVHAHRPSVPPFEPVHRRVAAQARRTPDATAVVGDDGVLTYAGLRRRSGALAAALVAAGVRPEDVVVVRTPYATSLVVAALGVLEAGAAFVLIDGVMPELRVEQLVHDSRAAAMVLAGGLVAPPGLTGPVITLEDVPAAAAPRVELHPRSLAYLIYSSGSTGRPKGAMVEHGSFAEFTQWAVQEYGHREGRRCLLSSAVAYDGTILQLFPPLVAGGVVHVIDPRARLEIPHYVQLLAERQIACIDEVPSLLRELCAYLRASGHGPLPSLEVLSVGGEAISIELVRACRRSITRTGAIVNGYSPSETSPIVLTHRFDGTRDDEVSVLGTPRSHAQVLVLDAYDQPLPPGFAGELHVAGLAVSRGYRDRPGLTAARFVPSVGRDGGRMYRSGDRARWLDGGLVEFLGRSDRQVKVRGHRVELDEIEAVLRERPELAAAAVALHREGTGPGQIVAYVVPAPTARPELWPSLGEHLVYDDLVYQAMTNDLERNRKYVAAMRRHVPGKVVVDVGTGKDAVLAVLCVEAGARRVYAIETLEHAFVAAKQRVHELGLDDRITVLHGDSRSLALPEPVDVCVSEVFGGIGGCEGAAAILDDARRFLAPGGVVIPERSLTRIAAASLPPELHEEPRLSPLAARYVEAIFARVGRPFDVPVGIRGFSPELVASDSAVFEELDFRGPVPRAYVRDIELRLTTAARIDGFVLWLELETTPGEVIDTLHRQHCWMPTFFPVLYPGVEVSVGDRITATCHGTPSSDGVAMDYRIEGRLHRHGHAPLDFVHDCRPYETRYRGSPFHARLLDPAPPRRAAASDLELRLRDALARCLPDFMVPARFVELDALPMLASDKVDYLALPAPSRERRAAGLVAPRTPTEATVAAIWAELLGLDEVGVTDDFFRCGGHSLVATQLASRLREAFQVEWSVRDVLERPTIAAQAERLAHAVASAPVPPVTPRASERRPPASFAQERLWFLAQLDPDSPFYTAAAMLTLTGRLDRTALARALDMLVRRHESLRTSFAVEDGRPVQVIAPPHSLAIEHVSASAASVAELVRERVQRPFDLAVAPLVRVTLLALGETDHRLLITLHHIICDGWSVGVLARELAANYAHATGGEPGPRGEPRLQYADYAVWQRQAHEAGRFDAQRDYWRRQLEGAPARLELPTDRPRPRVLRHEGATQPVFVPAAVAGALMRLGEREGATLFMVVLAAFQVLLRRYCPQTDIVVGFPIANRHRGELEGLIGLFANTLVLRMDLARDRSFRTLVQQARRAALDAYAHQDVPFESLLQELRIERDLGFQPLFQVALVMHETPLPPIELPGLVVTVEELDTGTAKFDLCLELAVDGDALTGKLEYSTELFDASTIERIVSNLGVLLAACAEDPERTILGLPVTTAAERARVLTEWNQTASAAARDASLPQLFAAQVAQRPDALAVVDGDDHVSYRALASRVGRLARRLARLGVGPETMVGVLMERSVAAVVGMLAVVERGAAFVGLDPTLPRERLVHIVRETAPRVLLAQRGLAIPEAYEGEVVVVEEFLAEGREREREREPVRVQARGDGLAYIVYTSGTTGRPKGIAMTHASLANEIAWQLEQSPSGRPLRMLQLSSLGFDIAYLETFSTLAEGGTLVVVPEPTRRDPQATLAAMLELGVERLIATYPMVQSLAHAAVGRGGRLPWLRELVSTGEELRVTPEIAALLETNPGLLLGNYYGPSECDVVTSFWLRERPVPTGSVAIGRPIANTRIHLLDGAMALVPIGATGEVWIGGTCVGRGYLGQPGATAERFVPDPLGVEAGARLYRTGDLARHLADGNVRYFGRADRQIKIRGVRIEPGEIEVALTEHDAVREAYVTTHAASAGRLVAYVVLHEGAALDQRRLADHLRLRLPHTMVPASYVALERLPLDPNGKLDWKRLPAPAPAGARATGAQAPPRTAVEAAVAGIWREVLEVELVGRDDNFFDLGGDSLRIARVHAKLVAALGVELSIVELFQHPTLEALAELLARRTGGSEPTAALPAPRAEVRRELADERDAARARRRAGRAQLGGDPRGKRSK